MPGKKHTNLQQLQRLLKQAQQENDALLVEELEQVRQILYQPRPRALRHLARLLHQATSQVTKHYVAQVLGAANDARVLRPLMRAVEAVENRQHRAPFHFACAAYDCTSHLSFFVRALLQCPEPDEAMAACVLVLEEMKGPFEGRALKRHVARLLRRDGRAVAPDLQLLDEVLTTQAAYALLDKYFEQVDRAWKTEVIPPSDLL